MPLQKKASSAGDDATRKRSHPNGASPEHLQSSTRYRSPVSNPYDNENGAGIPSLVDDDDDAEYIPESLASFVAAANQTLEATQKDFFQDINAKLTPDRLNQSDEGRQYDTDDEGAPVLLEEDETDMKLRGEILKGLEDRRNELRRLKAELGLESVLKVSGTEPQPQHSPVIGQLVSANRDSSSSPAVIWAAESEAVQGATRGTRSHAEVTTTSSNEQILHLHDERTETNIKSVLFPDSTDHDRNLMQEDVSQGSYDPVAWLDEAEIVSDGKKIEGAGPSSVPAFAPDALRIDNTVPSLGNKNAQYNRKVEIDATYSPTHHNTLPAVQHMLPRSVPTPENLQHFRVNSLGNQHAVELSTSKQKAVDVSIVKEDHVQHQTEAKPNDTPPCFASRHSSKPKKQSPIGNTTVTLTTKVSLSKANLQSKKGAKTPNQSLANPMSAVKSRSASSQKTNRKFGTHISAPPSSSSSGPSHVPDREMQRSVVPFDSQQQLYEQNGKKAIAARLVQSASAVHYSQQTKPKTPSPLRASLSVETPSPLSMSSPLPPTPAPRSRTSSGASESLSMTRKRTAEKLVEAKAKFTSETAERLSKPRSYASATKALGFPLPRTASPLTRKSVARSTATAIAFCSFPRVAKTASIPRRKTRARFTAASADRLSKPLSRGEPKVEEQAFLPLRKSPVRFTKETAMRLCKSRTTPVIRVDSEDGLVKSNIRFTAETAARLSKPRHAPIHSDLCNSTISSKRSPPKRKKLSQDIEKKSCNGQKTPMEQDDVQSLPKERLNFSEPRLSQQQDFVISKAPESVDLFSQKRSPSRQQMQSQPLVVSPLPLSMTLVPASRILSSPNAHALCTSNVVAEPTVSTSKSFRAETVDRLSQPKFVVLKTPRSYKSPIRMIKGNKSGTQSHPSPSPLSMSSAAAKKTLLSFNKASSVDVTAVNDSFGYSINKAGNDENILHALCEKGSHQTSPPRFRAETAERLAKPKYSVSETPRSSQATESALAKSNRGTAVADVALCSNDLGQKGVNSSTIVLSYESIVDQEKNAPVGQTRTLQMTSSADTENYLSQSSQLEAYRTTVQSVAGISCVSGDTENYLAHSSEVNAYTSGTGHEPDRERLREFEVQDQKKTKQELKEKQGELKPVEKDKQSVSGAVARARDRVRQQQLIARNVSGKENERVLDFNQTTKVSSALYASSHSAAAKSRKSILKPRLLLPGVKTVSRRPLTIPQAPRFATDARLGPRSTAPSQKVAGPFERGLRSDDLSVASSVSSAKKSLPTVPESPKFAKLSRSKARANERTIEVAMAQSTDVLRKALRDTSQPAMTRPKGPTVPMSPKFQKIAQRQLPKSSEERDLEEIEQYKSHPFKATSTVEINAVPVKLNNANPTKRRLTIQQPFNLHSDNKIESHKASKDARAETEVVVSKQFQARPMPTFSQTKGGLVGVPRVVSRERTIPQPFNFARGNNQHQSNTSPQKTVVQPFHLSTSRIEKRAALIEASHRKAAKLALEKGEVVQEKEELRHKASMNESKLSTPKVSCSVKVPVSSPAKIPSVRKLTEPKPFHFETDKRHQASAEKMKYKLMEEEVERRIALQLKTNAVSDSTFSPRTISPKKQAELSMTKEIRFNP